MGRINEFEEDEPNIPPYMDYDGYVRIHWNSDKMRKHIQEGLRVGRCTLPIRGIGSTIPKYQRAPRMSTDVGSWS